MIIQLIISNTIQAQTKNYDSLFCYDSHARLVSFYTSHMKAEFEDLILTKYNSQDCSVLFNPLKMELNLVSLKKNVYSVFFDNERPFLMIQDSFQNVQTIALNIYHRDTMRKFLEGEHTSFEKINELVVSGVYNSAKLKRIDLFLDGNQVTAIWSLNQVKVIDFKHLDYTFKLNFNSGQIDFITFRFKNIEDSNSIVFSRLKRFRKGFSWIYYSLNFGENISGYNTIYLFRRNGKLKRKYMNDKFICKR